MKKRKWLASLLAVVMVLAMMPTMAFAAGDTVEVSNGMTFTSDTTQSDIDTWPIVQQLLRITQTEPTL